MHLASRMGRADIVTLLVENNANVHLTDGEGRSALHAAALYVPLALEGQTPTVHDGEHDAVDYDVPKGVHCDASNANRDVVVSAFEPSARVVDVLLTAGADFGFKNAGADGVTPLYLAALVGNVGVAAALLAAGASIDDKDAMGRTPP